MADETYLSPAEIAQRWGRSRDTVLRLIKSGSLPGYWVAPRTVVVAESDYREFMSKAATAGKGGV